MLNQIQCTAVEFNAAAYNEADSIVLFLCKECAAAIDKLELPEAAAKLVTLSTCSYEFDNARYVVVGVLTLVEEAANS